MNKNRRTFLHFFIGLNTKPYKIVMELPKITNKIKKTIAAEWKIGE